MPPIILLAIPIGFLAFWVWMYREMMRNEYLTPAAKNYWTMMFIFFNVLTAVYYYATEYRNNH